MKALIVMNHCLSEDQIKDLKNNWNIVTIDCLNEKEQSLWGNVPPDMSKDDLLNHLEPIIGETERFNLIVLAGELTACIVLTDALRRQGVRILTATSRRESVETVSPNGEVIKRSVFKHVRFREL